MQGGSTITQQFVKNSLVHNQRTIARKLKEAALAWQLESDRGTGRRQRILTAYLNTIYFGNGAYGVETASKTYFGHGATKLTLAEAALLAGIPEDPSRWDPVSQPARGRDRRREIVLRAMLDQGHITHADFVRANARAAAEAGGRAPAGRRRTCKAPYFTNYVKQLLVDQLRLVDRVFGGGLRVRTSINLRVQQRRARRDREVARLDRIAPSAALVAIDPRDGRVLAMVGGSNYRKSQFNLAVQGERQPGSSFKPFVLATALEEGIAPGVAARLEAGRRSMLDGTSWPVHNYEGSYLGPIDLQQATIHSDNSVYAQLTRLVGPANVVQHRAPARDHEPAQAVPLDRARRAGRQPARDGARVLRRSRTAAFASTARSTGEPSARDPRGRRQGRDRRRVQRAARRTATR